MSRVFTGTAAPRASSAASTGCVGVDPDAEQTLGRLRPQRARLLRASASSFLYAAPAGAGPPAAVARHRRRAPGQALGTPRSLRDQHQLAVVLRRVDDGPPGPDGRPGGAELRRPRPSASPSRSPWSAGFAASRTDRLGNFWVDLTRGTLRILLPLAFVARDRAGRRRRGAEPLRRHRRDHADRRDAARHRRPGRLAGGDQGARHQRRRLLQRQLGAPVREPDARGPTCCRSSCCC